MGFNGSLLQGWQTENEIIIKSNVLVYRYKTASINPIMNTILRLATLLTIYSVIDNPDIVQLFKLQLFLYVHFHF